MGGQNIGEGKGFWIMNWLRRLMYGRYGMDQLGYGLLIGSFLFMLLFRLTGWRIFSLLAVVLLAICYLRLFSRDFMRRRAENQIFLRYWGPVGAKFSGWTAFLRESRYYHHLKCPSCRQKIRVPRGKGRICITCPKCRAQFIKKT